MHFLSMQQLNRELFQGPVSLLHLDNKWHRQQSGEISNLQWEITCSVWICFSMTVYMYNDVASVICSNNWKQTMLPSMNWCGDFSQCPLPMLFPWQWNPWLQLHTSSLQWLQSSSFFFWQSVWYLIQPCISMRRNMRGLGLTTNQVEQMNPILIWEHPEMRWQWKC